MAGLERSLEKIDLDSIKLHSLCLESSSKSVQILVRGVRMRKRNGSLHAVVLSDGEFP